MAPAAVACARTPAPPPVTRVLAHEGFLAGAGGTRLFYRVMGSAPDTVVVVHGGPGAGLNAVRPDLQPLARTHTVVFYDQRGAGRSELPADTTRLDARAHVEDLDAVRRHFGLASMRVVAHGFGAVLVARYAESHPERLERVVFLDAVAPVRAGPDGADALADAAAARADSATRQRLTDAERALRDGAAEDPVATCRAYEAVRREMAVARGDAPRWRGSRCDMPPRAVAYQFRHAAPALLASLGDWDFTTSLARLRTPLLLVHDADDADALASQRAWAAALPDARRLPVPRAGAGAAAARPELVLPAIEAFLAGRWPAGTVVP
ncbi:alpha/beta fold hydrolase [Roseisolibacter agri]|uniref:alpha/beta fold hydrolase n=1 Tax=Roseisolibacter agri TaxID=2014610 RepID=UPI0024E0E670|nr:alpha/beta hydrolase [Roseisolibacter agri]